MSSKAQILAAAVFKTEVVALHGGATITLREMSGSMRDAYEQGMIRTVDGKREADLSNMRAKLIAPCAIDDETGEPMFTVAEVGALPASILEPLWNAARRLNGMDGDAVDTAVKNSVTGPSDASPSA